MRIDSTSAPQDLFATILSALQVLLLLWTGLSGIVTTILLILFAAVCGSSATLFYLKNKGVIAVRELTPEEARQNQKAKAIFMIVVVILMALIVWSIISK